MKFKKLFIEINEDQTLEGIETKLKELGYSCITSKLYVLPITDCFYTFSNGKYAAVFSEGLVHEDHVVTKLSDL